MQSRRPAAAGPRPGPDGTRIGPGPDGTSGHPPQPTPRLTAATAGMSSVGELVCCTDCGRHRKNHRGGRCARCYRLAKTDVVACTRCGNTRRCWAGVCTPCKLQARAEPGVCTGCGRRVRRLWPRGRCAACAHTGWTVGSCVDCLAWAWSIAGTPARCRACRDFAARNRPGQCRWCRRRLPVNRWDDCRLCAATRRFPGTEDRHTTGAPIQLFLGDLEFPRAPRASGTGPESSVPAVTTAVTQPTLFDLTPE